MQKLKALVILAFFTAPLAGCFVNTRGPLKCGRGTHLHNGRCVANR